MASGLPQTAQLPAKRGLALALGAGGARGLAHIVVLEALDELGLRPSRIAGASMGAIIGAAYAAGMPARAIRAFVLASFRDRTRVAAKLLDARVGKLSDLISRAGVGNPVLVDAERLLDLFWPREVPDRFEQLKIPFTAVATDYHLRAEVELSSGPLTPAVGASMALPGLVKPVVIEGRVLIDGGAVTPLPIRQARGEGARGEGMRGEGAGDPFVVCVDVFGAAFVSDNRVPEAMEAMFGASQILMTAVAQRSLERNPPDLVLRPDVGQFAGLDFFKAQDILAAAEPIKDEVKRALDEALG
jgi:NTE family protein